MIWKIDWTKDSATGYFVCNVYQDDKLVLEHVTCGMATIHVENNIQMGDTFIETEMGKETCRMTGEEFLVERKKYNTWMEDEFMN